MNVPIEEEKICNKCKIKKNILFFGKDKRRKCEKRTVCKQCVNEKNKEWRKNNSDKVKICNKNYRESHKEVRLKYIQNNLNRYLFNCAKKRAQKSNLEFDLTLDNIIVPEKCPVLDIPLFKFAGKRTSNSPSIDRIDNSKGYIKGNIVIISWRANNLKRDASLQELQQLANFYRRFL